MNILKEGFDVFATITSVLEYKTLLCILSNTESDGSCSVTQETIARAINIHRQSVTKSIGQLERKNIISIERKGLNRIYHINPDYCITEIGYKELKKNFCMYTANNNELEEN